MISNLDFRTKQVLHHENEKPHNKMGLNFRKVQEELQRTVYL